MFYNVLDLIDIYNFHVGCFSWIISHLGENLAWSCEIIMYKTLRKISKSWNFLTFQVDFWLSWWSSLIFLHVLMKFDLWNVMSTKKSKFDFLICNWPFCPCGNSKPKLMYECCKLESWKILYGDPWEMRGKILGYNTPIPEMM